MYLNEKNGQKFNKAIKNVGLTKIVLTIAHLDHDKENFDVQDDRLKALCQRCHLVLDKEHHAEKRRDEFIEEQVERGLLIEEVKSFIKYLDENYNSKNQKND